MFAFDTHVGMPGSCRVCLVRAFQGPCTYLVGTWTLSSVAAWRSIECTQDLYTKCPEDRYSFFGPLEDVVLPACVEDRCFSYGLWL